MKTLILSIVVITLAFITNAQYITIPDENFLNALIEEGVDANEDGRISNKEAEEIIDLDVNSKMISDMTGIEAFINLITLDCGENQLTRLDISNNTALTTLQCGYNQITNLDVSNNIDLWRLSCMDNQLTSLDISNNTAILELHLSKNQLSSLDISSNFTEFHEKSSNPKGGGYNLLLAGMPSLLDVCVWSLPFPPDGFYLDTDDSPNVYFTTECEITNLKDSKENGIIAMYPNPTDDIINIEVKNPSNTLLKIYNTSGTLIFSKALNENHQNIDVSGYGPGLYFISVLNNEDIYTQKILIE